MKIDIHGMGTTQETKGEPFITISKQEIEDRTFGSTVCRVDVEKETGELARFWLTVSIKNGRPVATVTTKPDKHREKEVSKSVTGSFNGI